ncbi:hypothetical protein FACS189467_0410 [Bacteroidia bacterium]|nr:hypothetical protein FACS189467_0410 [Bacteroidia bacterium]
MSIAYGQKKKENASNSPTRAMRHHPAEPRMVYVEGGTFTMGCGENDKFDCTDDHNCSDGCYTDEFSLHQVTVSSFNIGRYEVTQAQWVAVMGSNPSNWKGDKLPVESVSWGDVQEFIARLNSKTGKQYRLPTEAEWEFAARGGNRSKHYKYSGNNNIEAVAWYWGNAGEKTHAVGTKSPNELGIYDMTGNVWEWCSDWYGKYSSSSQTNPKGALGSIRVLRGGSWLNSAQNCRVAGRGAYNPIPRLNVLGFRLVLPSSQNKRN